MATALSDTRPTLMDLAKRTENGALAQIVNTISQTNPILQDIEYEEANQGASHITTMVTGIPSGTFRLLNRGVQPEKITTVQQTDTISLLETYLEVDCRVARLSGDVNRFRSEDARFAMEGLGQTHATAFFYGNANIDPEKFTGLDARYNDLSAGNAGNIIDDGGSSALTSIWLINMRKDKIHGIYGRGADQQPGTEAQGTFEDGTLSGVGIRHQDLGEDTITDANGGRLQAYRSHLVFEGGLSVRDWRFIVRGANIDTSALLADFATGPNLVEIMTNMLETIESLDGMPIFYCNRTIKKFLRHHAKNTNNVNLTLDMAGGKEMLMFDGYPIHLCDAITNTEAQVT